MNACIKTTALTLSVSIVALLILVVPLVGHGASNDVTLTTDTVISVNGISLNVSGSSATVASITVNAEDFSFVLESGSAIEVRSSDRKVLVTNAASQYISTNTCDDSESKLKHTSSASGSVSITITPGTSTCTTSATSAIVDGGGGIIYGGGGGGGGSPSTPITAPPAVVPQPVPAPSTSPVAGATFFTRTLTIGSTGSDVLALQIFLNANGFLVADSGVGSPGNETEYFGSLTQQAVQAFQKVHDVVSSGTPNTTGYGLVGPKTRATLNALLGGEESSTPTPAPTPAPSGAIPSALFSIDLSAGMEHPDVERLQRLLNTDSDTRLATEGPGSPGNETDYYGLLTERAVQAFQAKYGIVSSGAPNTTGYGRVGPQTRAMLEEVF